MGRKRNEIPSYRRCADRDRGRVVIEGFPTIYFPGPYNSPQSRAAYNRWLAGYLATGQIRPEDEAPETTIGELFLGFTERLVEKRYIKHGHPTSERRSYAVALTPVSTLYCDTPADRFTTKDLKRCRDALVAKGYTRKRINQHVGRIRRCFKWGVEEGLVSAITWQALLAVEGLKLGEAKCEHRLVPPVPLNHVEAIAPFVTPPVWAAIQLQLWTGCRPGEALAIRTCDIRAEDPDLPAAVQSLCWVYRPPTHKREHHGLPRLILLGPHAQAVIEPWLRPGDPTAPLFSPREAKAWSIAKRVDRARRHRNKLQRVDSPQRIPREMYGVHALAVAIRRACKKAGVPRWHAHQIRHAAATKIASTYGIEVARVILGHQHIKTTELYAAADLIKAAEAVAAIG